MYSRVAYIGLLMMAILIGSMYVMPTQQAQALSEVTFTALDTPSSVATTNWQRVYENGTSTVMFFDGNSNGTYNKKVYNIGTDTLTSSNSAAIVATDSGSILSTPTASTASSTDATGVAWYSQTAGSTTEAMHEVGTTGMTAKAVNTASALYNKPINSVDIWICEDGSAPGSAKIGVFGSDLTPVFTIATPVNHSADCDSVAPQQTTYTKAAGTGYHLMTSGQRLGIVYNDPSSTSTQGFDVQFSGSNSDGTTNTVYSQSTSGGAWVDDNDDDMKIIARFVPAVTDADDGDTISFWRNNADSEAGSYLCSNQGASKRTTGVKAYFPEATEIPQTLDVLIGSACNTGTDVGDWNTAGTVGYDSFNFTATVGQYVTIKVKTWGSDVRFRVSELQTFIDGQINSTPFTSFIETNSTLFVAGRDTAAGFIGVTKWNVASMTQLADYFTSSSKTVKDVAQSQTKVYIALVDGSNNLYLGIIDRSLGSATYSEVSMGDTLVAAGFAHLAVYSGSPDTIYIMYSKSSTQVKTVKYTSSASILGTIMTQGSNVDFQITQLSGKVIAHTSNRLYELNTSSDAITQIYGSAMLTKYPQSFNMTAGVITYHTAVAYAADATYATQYVPNTGVSSQAAILVSAKDTGTGTLTVYAPAKYYMLSKNGYVVDAATAAATSWTIKALGSRTTINPVPYQENLNVALVNDRTLLLDDVFRLVCDVSYHINSYALEKFAVGDDSDCTSWTILATSGATVGRRILNYSQDSDLIHADVYTAYTFELSGGDPDDYPDYRVQTLYDDKYADEVDMDAEGTGQQRWLYGQCYEVHLINGTTGALIDSFDPICANDFFTKTIDLGGGGASEGNSTGLGFVAPIVVPSDFSGHVWFHEGLRNFTAGEFQYNAERRDKPYTVSINTTISVPGHGAVSDVQTFTNYNDQAAVGYGSVPGLGFSTIPSNATIYVVGEDENGVGVFSDVFVGQQLALGDMFSGLKFAKVPMPGIALVLLSLLFVKSNAHIGAITVVAAAGILVAWGVIAQDVITPGIWGFVFVLTALAVVTARRRFS